jgi:hypothetical protein
LSSSDGIDLFSRLDQVTGTWVQEEVGVGGNVGGYRPVPGGLFVIL